MPKIIATMIETPGNIVPSATWAATLRLLPFPPLLVMPPDDDWVGVAKSDDVGDDVKVGGDTVAETAVGEAKDKAEEAAETSLHTSMEYQLTDELL